MATDWRQLEHDILQRLDIASEATALGVRFANGQTTDKGWRECHAIDREDTKPSAAINVDSDNGSLGKYTDRGNGEKAISFFELAVRLGKFADFRAAREHYAQLTGIELPATRKRKSRKLNLLGDVLWNHPSHNSVILQQHAEKFTRAKPGVSVEQILRCKVAPGNWHGIQVIGFAGYKPGAWETPTAIVLYRPCGKNFAAAGAIPERKAHLVTDSTDSLVIVGNPTDLATAETIWLCEGLTDALTIANHLPTGQLAITNTHGAGSFDVSLREAFVGKYVIIVMDADTAGQSGVGRRTAILLGFAGSVKVARLPYPIEPKHGKDVRDFFNEGHTFEELLATVEVAKEPKSSQLVDLLAIETPECQTEVANSKRMSAKFGDAIRWCDPWGKWLVWDGRRWEIDGQRRIDRLAKEVVQDLWRQVSTTVVVDAGSRKAMTAFAKSSNGAKSIGNMLALTRSDVALRPDALDKNPWLINVENGTIDLQSGALRPHDKSDYISKLAPVKFVPDASCPTWEYFLQVILDHNGDLISYVRRLVGYCLTGSTREHILPFLYGIGANGKSTFVGTILALLGGDYAIKAPTDLLLVKQGESHPTERADLHGKRFVACIEAVDGRRLAESLVKELTGGDNVRARRMREDFWEFVPTHKIWLAANHKPIVRGTDNGIWRRVKLIPFTVTIRDEAQDKRLPEKLLAELPGILNWAIAGCREWQSNGLGEPLGVRKATGDYRSEMDVVGAFINDECELSPAREQSAASLYARYKLWCERNGEHYVNQRRFGISLTERGLELKRGMGGIWIRKGIGVVQLTKSE